MIPNFRKNFFRRGKKSSFEGTNNLPRNDQYFLVFLQNGKSPGSIVVNIASPKPDDGEREEGEIKEGDESIQILERFVLISNSYD